MPPPTPVPRITPNTVAAPAAAPSVASDSVKQSASLAMRTSRPSRALRSSRRHSPLSQVELQLRMRPDTGEAAPGVPTPTLPLSPNPDSMRWTSAAMASSVCA